jgi:hypothetical protein
MASMAYGVHIGSYLDAGLSPEEHSAALDGVLDAIADGSLPRGILGVVMQLQVFFVQ